MEESKKITEWDLLPDTLTAQHIADFLGISRRRVYELCKIHENAGGIPSFNIGKTNRVIKSDFEKWIYNKKAEKSGCVELIQ